MTIKEKIKSTLIYIALLAITVYLGSWVLVQMLKQADLTPVKCECINL